MPVANELVCVKCDLNQVGNSCAVMRICYHIFLKEANRILLAVVLKVKRQCLLLQLFVPRT